MKRERIPRETNTGRKWRPRIEERAHECPLDLFATSPTNAESILRRSLTSSSRLLSVTAHALHFSRHAVSIIMRVPVFASDFSERSFSRES